MNYTTLTLSAFLNLLVCHFHDEDDGQFKSTHKCKHLFFIELSLPIRLVVHSFAVVTTLTTFWCLRFMLKVFK